MVNLKVTFYNSTLFLSVVNGNKNQVFKLLEDKCEIIKENEFNELLFSGDKIVSYFFQ